jgi:hypothetical protein
VRSRSADSATASGYGSYGLPLRGRWVFKTHWKISLPFRRSGRARSALCVRPDATAQNPAKSRGEPPSPRAGPECVRRSGPNPRRPSPRRQPATCGNLRPVSRACRPTRHYERQVVGAAQGVTLRGRRAARPSATGGGLAQRDSTRGDGRGRRRRRRRRRRAGDGERWVAEPTSEWRVTPLAGRVRGARRRGGGSDGGGGAPPVRTAGRGGGGGRESGVAGRVEKLRPAVAGLG